MVQPQAAVTATDRVEVAVTGLAAWEGLPVATLVASDGTRLQRPNGEDWTSLHQPFYWNLAAEPSYETSVDPMPRTFMWTLRFPVQHTVPGVFALPAGDWYVSVELPDGSVVETDLFTVTRD